MEFLPIDRSKGEKSVYPAPGKCIYCDTTDGPLDDEHIIPFGLAGDGIVFKNASCKPCAEIFNKQFETHVLGSMYLPVRIRAGAPTRNPRKRPKFLELRLVAVDDENRPVRPADLLHIPSGEMPFSLIGWSPPPPGILVGREPTDEILGEPWTTFWEHEFAPYIDQYKRRTGHKGVVAVSVGRMEPDKFLRFIAKCAYGFAVAVEGIGSFEPLVLDILYGRSQHICHYVGDGAALDTSPTSIEETFRVLVGEYRRAGRKYVIALVRPWAMLDAPSYLVVVGIKREAD